MHLEGKRSLSVTDGDVDFGYWHIVPAVTHHQRVKKHQLVGHVEAPWLHVHFAEHRSDRYRDPLRPGALTPWRDTTKPHVTRIVLLTQRPGTRPGSDLGAVDVIAEAHQMPPLAVPAPWDEPAGDTRPCPLARAPRRPHHAGLAHTDRLQQGAAPRRGVQPHLRARERGRTGPGKPGLYRFFLAHTWSTTLLDDGQYRLEVEATDLRGSNGPTAPPHHHRQRRLAPSTLLR